MHLAPHFWNKIEERNGPLETTLQLLYFNPSCTKVFGTHTFYEGGGLSRPPYDLKNGRLYKLQLWQAIRTIYER